MIDHCFIVKKDSPFLARSFGRISVSDSEIAYMLSLASLSLASLLTIGERCCSSIFKTEIFLSFQVALWLI